MDILRLLMHVLDMVPSKSHSRLDIRDLTVFSRPVTRIGPNAVVTGAAGTEKVLHKSD